MIDTECPSCGRRGRVPREKVESRLVCKKCHAIFHMNTAGRPVMGEPVVAKTKGQRQHVGSLAAAVKEKATKLDMPEFTVTKNQAIISLVAVGVMAIAAFLFGRPGEVLNDRAEVVAQAILADDLKALKSMSNTAGADAIVRWYEHVQPRVAAMKKEGKAIRATVLVVEENRNNRVGQVMAFIGPADDAAVGALAMANAVEVPLNWTLEGGRWRLDADKTLVAAQSK